MDDTKAARIWEVFDRKWQEWRNRVAAGASDGAAAAGEGAKRLRGEDAVAPGARKACRDGAQGLEGTSEGKLAGNVAGAGGAQVSDTIPDSEDEEENRVVSCTNC